MNIFHGRQKPESPAQFTEQDVAGQFGPSRIPPCVAFQVPHARPAIEKRFPDLLKIEDGQPPALIQVSLADPKYRHLARPPRTLAVRRKSADLYKGRQCARVGVAPLTGTSFISSPTARRCGIKILRTSSAFCAGASGRLISRKNFCNRGICAPKIESLSFLLSWSRYHGPATFLQ